METLNGFKVSKEFFRIGLLRQSRALGTTHGLGKYFTTLPIILRRRVLK